MYSKARQNRLKKISTTRWAFDSVDFHWISILSLWVEKIFGQNSAIISRIPRQYRRKWREKWRSPSFLKQFSNTTKRFLNTCKCFPLPRYQMRGGKFKNILSGESERIPSANTTRIYMYVWKNHQNSRLIWPFARFEKYEIF